MFRLDQASQRKSNISDGMVFKKNYTNKQIKLKWTATPSNNVFKILVGLGVKKGTPWAGLFESRLTLTQG